MSRQGAVVLHATRDFTVTTVQKAADLAVQAGSQLYTDSASSYRALKGYMHEFVNHTRIYPTINLWIQIWIVATARNASKQAVMRSQRTTKRRYFF